MDWKGGRRGVSFHFFLTDAGECSSSNSGVSSGKNISSIMERGEPAITINERKRPVRAHKGEKRHNNQQRITRGMEGRTEEKRERGKQHMRS